MTAEAKAGLPTAPDGQPADDITADIQSPRLRTLMAMRVAVVTVLFGSFLYFEIGFGIFPYPRAVMYLIAFLYVTTIFYALMLGRLPGRLHAYIQLSTDSVFVVTLIFLTGGIESWFSPLMLLTVLAAPILINKRAGYYTATLLGLLYGLLIDIQYYGLLPIAYDPMLMEKDFLFNIFTHIMALFLTAGLTGYLSSRLERTSRRLLEKDIDLKDLTLFHEEVVENVPNGLFTTDTSGTVVLFNRAAEEITGVSKDDAVGKPVSSFMPFLRNIGKRNYAEETIKHNGADKVIGITVSGIKDTRGSDTGFIGIFQDLTHLKGMELEMKKREKLAAIGELSANIAHEIRNPLASLKGAIEILKEDNVSKEHKENLMHIAIAEMDRLNTIITDFLSYSRSVGLQPSTFSLIKILDETLELLMTREPEGVAVVRDFPGDVIVRADAKMLQQVFWNLGINALETMPGGGELTVGVRNDGENAVITFSDTGQGIPPEEVERIFFPFFTTKPRGTGLGLSIAYRIVEDHGGKIHVKSKPGQGTSFSVSIPKAGV